MKIRTMRFPLMTLIALLAIGLAANAQNAPDFSKVEIETTKVRQQFLYARRAGRHHRHLGGAGRHFHGG